MGAMARWETSHTRGIISLRQSVITEKNRFKYALNVCHRRDQDSAEMSILMTNIRLDVYYVLSVTLRSKRCVVIRNALA